MTIAMLIESVIGKLAAKEAPPIGGGERERVDPADGNPLAHARRHIALDDVRGRTPNAPSANAPAKSALPNPETDPRLDAVLGKPRNYPSTARLRNMRRKTTESTSKYQVNARISRN